MQRDDLKVGQRVWVHEGFGRNSAPQRGEVTRIGRLLVTINLVYTCAWGEDKGREAVRKEGTDYRIADQKLNDRKYTDRAWFETDEQREVREHNNAVNEYLFAVGVRFDDHKCRVTQEHRERVAGLLRELGYAS